MHPARLQTVRQHPTDPSRRFNRIPYLFLPSLQLAYRRVWMQTEDEFALLTRASAGDKAAFRLLVDLHYQCIYRFALRLTGVPHSAEDVTQECFLQLLREHRFDQRLGRLRSYLYGIARHLARRHCRSATREVNWDSLTGSNWDSGEFTDDPGIQIDVSIT